ncbi:MAG: hypothetical protein P1V97_01895 [Planctomycetota bacterium]|nr:hypothetical protein [Planctomycetota bacterium]
MGDEDRENENLESEAVQRLYPHISTSWQYLTLPTIVLSFCCLLLLTHKEYPTLKSWLFWILPVSMVLHLIVSVLAVCPFCGKTLTFRPPLKGEAQGRLFFFPLKNCWNCKREVHSPKATLGKEKIKKID